MKKLLRGACLTLALALLLSVTALAAAPTTAGIYNVDWSAAAASGYTVDTDSVMVLAKDTDPATATAGIAKSTATINNEDVDFYAEGAKVNFTISGLTSGTTYKLILGLNKQTTSPQEPDIEYIDQGTASGGTVNFTVYPKAATGTISLYVDDASGTIKKIGSFDLYQPYMLGDVNGDKAVNSTDALWVLQYTAHSPIRNTLTPTQFLAADVNKDSSVNSTDALWILQFTAHSPLRPSL